MYLFFQALGRYRYDGDPSSQRRTGTWELVPGIHWRMGDNCWMSLGASRFSLLTCSWQF
jgi:hypothetical protein